MSRLMSCAMTEDAVVERRKTVTRRKGWWEDRNGKRLLLPGQRLTLCRKLMGRKPGEPVVRLAEVRVVDVRRELLRAMTQDDVAREGFPDMDRVEFINRFFVNAQGIYGDDTVTRIEWEYLDHHVPTPGRVWTDPVKRPEGGTRLRVKRCCNGCGRELGDAHEVELEAAVAGRPLPDVRDECGLCLEGVGR